MDGTIEVTVAVNIAEFDSAVSGSLFEPYRESKESGMGLSGSPSIIEAQNGRLQADEQRRQGALFCMPIPGSD